MPATEEGRRARALADVARGELGAPGIATVGGWLDTWEDAPELRFPLSATVYDKMRRDAQLDSVLRAIRLAVMRTRWRLVGDDVRPEVMRSVAMELGLADDNGDKPNQGLTVVQVNRLGRRRMKRAGVNFGELIHHGLLMLPFGFLPCEQVYAIGPPAPGQTGPATMAHVAKIAPRMPRSLTEVIVERDGGLGGIKQQIPRRDGGPGWEEVTIPRDRLVMFVNEREGADWTGRSIFRSSYPHWLIKQRLMKLGAAIVERNGMGVPVVNYPAGPGNRAEALKIARAFRAGEESGAALPVGYSIKLVGVEGDTADELPRIEYHDQAMGRASLAMFLNLGHDNGARALGDTFRDLFADSVDGIDEDLGLLITEYVIRDFVELNYGAEEPYPDLVADPINAEGTPTAEALGILSKNGLLGPMDPDLVNDVRRRYGLPKAPDVPTGVPMLDGTTEADTPDDATLLSEPGQLAARALAVAARLAELDRAA